MKVVKLTTKMRSEGLPEGYVYCGRPSKWGNPFVMGGPNSRDTVCDKFERWFLSQPQLIADAKKELRGKTLVCFCAPKRCHCDTLLRVANS